MTVPAPTPTQAPPQRPMRLAPSILSADFSRLGEELRAIERAGADLVLNPATPLDCLDHVMDKLDMVLLMSVNPGFGGQKFIASTLPKLRAVRQRIDAHMAAGGEPIWLEVDGGVKTDNIHAIVQAGADTCVAGSAVFGAPDADGGYQTVMAELRRQAVQR
jgi:ribulose-phosphate 3-epimerase